MLKLLKVDKDAADTILDSVSHQRFDTARASHWLVEAGKVDGGSVCWLFCWATTGMGSENATYEAKQAFNKILKISFSEFDKRVGYSRAQQLRYHHFDPQVDAELKESLGL